MTDSQLTMYSTVWCGYCKRLKTALKASGISFTEVDIEHDPAAAEYVMKVNGGRSYVYNRPRSRFRCCLKRPPGWV
jgi:mycoredoxin